MNRTHASPLRTRRSLVAVAVACCFAPALALANPTGPTVVSGQASFSSQGKQLTVTNTPGSIINWQGFSVGVGETTRFVQQSAQSMVLNRVTGADPSSILGTLQSNGRIVLVNPNGIMFGAGAIIDVAGMIASTLNITNADFLAGRMRFGDTPGAGLITNAGEIRTPLGGKVVLIAPQGVENSGVIHAPKGEVILAAGKTVELADTLNPEVRVEISAPEARAINLGRIVAESGKVGIYGGIVANRGLVSADSAVVGENGKIVFRSTKETNLEAGSVVTASGKSGGTVEIGSSGTALVAGSVKATGSESTGGTVHVLGENVGVIGQGSIDASGERGGGTVLVGGDLQGANPNVRNAQMTYVGADTSLKADAIGEGTGGKVIVWADDTTRSHGAISARGGQRGGDGGFVETSGKVGLEVTSGPDVRAPAGRAGTWLIDPNNIEIVAGSVFDKTTNTGAPFFAPLTDSSQIGVDLINAQLDFGSNVLITTTSRGATAGTEPGNITVSAPITKSAKTVPGGPFIGTTTLTLQAHNDIIINPAGTITTTGDPLNVTLTANFDGVGGGAVTMGGAITTLGGSVSISGADLVQTTAPINTLNALGTAGGTVQLSSSANQVNVASDIASGFFSASGSTGTTIAAPVSAKSSFQASSANGMTTIASTITATSSVTLSGRNGVRVASGSQITTGPFSSFSASVTDPGSASTLSIEAGSQVTSNGAVLTSDNMDIQGLLNAGTGSITARQNLAGRAITLGAEVGGTLSLSPLEVSNLMTTSTLTIGNSSSGNVTFAGPVTTTSPSVLSVNSGTAIAQNAGLTTSASLFYNAPTVTIAAPIVSTSPSSISITTDNLTAGSTVNSAGNIDVVTRTSTRPITLGLIGAPTGAALELTAGQLNNFITPTRLRFTTNNAPITIANSIAPTGTSTLSLNSPNNTIAESGGAIVTVSNLALSARSIDFAQDNDVTTLAAQVVCCSAGNINFVSKAGKLVNVGTVDGISGVTVNNFSGTANITLQADDLNVTQLVQANLGNVIVKPRSAATPVTLGADVGGTLGLTTTEIGLIQGTTLTVAGDRMDIAAPVSFSSATTTLAPFTAARPVSIVTGAKATPGDLQFLDTEFANLTGGTVIIGGPTAGPLAVNAPFTIPGSVGTLILQSADTTSGITVAPGADIMAANTVGMTTDVLALGATLTSANGGINIATNTGARNITLSTDPGGTLGLDTAELGRLSAPLGTLSFVTGGGSIGVSSTGIMYGPGTIGGLSLNAGTDVTVGFTTNFLTPTPITISAPTITTNSAVSAATGDITLVGNSITLGSTVTATAGNVNVARRTSGSIDLGGPDGGSLGLDNTDLVRLVASGVVRIGDLTGTTGNINVSSAISLPAGRKLSLQTSSGGVTQGAGATITVDDLAVNAFNAITLSQPNVVTNVAMTSQNSSVNFTRGTGGGLNVTNVDSVSGVTARFGTSPVTLTADQINVGAAIQGSTVTLAPTAAGTIDIGTKPGGGLFGFNQSEFDQIFATSVVIGNGLSGNVTVSQPLTFGTFSDFSIFTGSTRTVTVSPGADLVVPRDFAVSAGTLMTSAPITSNFGTITLVTDSITLGGMVNSGGGAINIRPLTAGNFIDVGGPDVVSTTSTLGLDATDLSNLQYTGGTLTVGSSTSGDMTVSHSGGLPDSVVLQTKPSSQVTVTGSTFSAGTNLTIQTDAMSIPGVAGIAAGSNITIKPSTVTPVPRNITLGTKPGTGLDLDVLELGKISTGPTGTLTFDTPGTLTTTAALAFTLVPNINFSGTNVVHTGGTLSASGDIALRGNQIEPIGFSAVNSLGGGRITLAPRSSSTMAVGTAPGGTLGILPAMLALLSTTGPVQIGDTSTTTAMTITAPISQPAGSSALVLEAGGNMTQTAGSTISATNLRLESFSTINLPENNTIGTLSGSSFGNFTVTSTGMMNIGTVDGVSGISDNTVTLRADSLNINDTISAGTVTLAPKSAGAPIILGTKSGFSLTDAEIDRISATTVNIGTSGTNPTGPITVSGPIDTNFMNLNLTTAAGSSITVNAALGSSTTSSLSLNTGLGGTIVTAAPLQASGQVSLTATGITIGGNVVSDFSQITMSPATGAVGSFATLNGPLTAFSNINITADNIAVNAPISTSAAFNNVNLTAFSNVASSTVNVNQQITAGNSINITTNNIGINAPLVTLGSSVTLQPKAPGVPISVGAETSGAFSVNTGELALITADSLTIGNTTAGPLTVNAAIGPFTYDSLSLRSGADVTQTPGSTITVRVTDPLNPLNVSGSLNVTAGGKIILPELNDIAVSVSGTASGTGNNFEFNNITPLKLQNVTGVFATSGKVLLSAPPGTFVFPPSGGGADRDALLDAALAALLKATDTQKNADKDAEERKEEGEKAEKEDQKKRGTQACS